MLASYPFTKLLLETYPNVNVFYTVVTDTGIARARELFGNRVMVTKFPFDSYRHLSNIHNALHPKALFVIETEIWPNLLLSAHERGVPIFLLNARISTNTVSHLRLIKRLSRYLLSAFTIIFARNKTDARLFTMAGADPSRIVVIGSLKYDTIQRPLKGLTRKELGFSDDRFVVVFGSVRSREFNDVVRAMQAIKGETGMVVAPRHLKNVPALVNLLRKHGFEPTLRSEKRPCNDGVLILDTIGELWDVYHLSNAAFVGGSLANYGGHNILEPAYAGIPVIFGPYIWNVEDYAYPMMEEGIAFRVYDGDELGRVLKELVRSPSKAASIGRKAREFVRKRAGVSRRILEMVKPYIEPTG